MISLKEQIDERFEYHIMFRKEITILRIELK